MSSRATTESELTRSKVHSGLAHGSDLVLGVQPVDLSRKWWQSEAASSIACFGLKGGADGQIVSCPSMIHGAKIIRNWIQGKSYGVGYYIPVIGLSRRGPTRGCNSTLSIAGPLTSSWLRRWFGAALANFRQIRW